MSIFHPSIHDIIETKTINAQLLKPACLLVTFCPIWNLNAGFFDMHQPHAMFHFTQTIILNLFQEQSMAFEGTSSPQCGDHMSSLIFWRIPSLGLGLQNWYPKINSSFQASSKVWACRFAKLMSAQGNDVLMCIISCLCFQIWASHIAPGLPYAQSLPEAYSVLLDRYYDRPRPLV